MQNREGEVGAAWGYNHELGVYFNLLAARGQFSTESGSERQVNCLPSPEMHEGENYHHVYRTTF